MHGILNLNHLLNQFQITFSIAGAKSGHMLLIRIEYQSENRLQIYKTDTLIKKSIPQHFIDEQKTANKKRQVSFNLTQ